MPHKACLGLLCPLGQALYIMPWALVVAKSSHPHTAELLGKYHTPSRLHSHSPPRRCCWISIIRPHTLTSAPSHPHFRTLTPSLLVIITQVLLLVKEGAVQRGQLQAEQQRSALLSAQLHHSTTEIAAVEYR